MTLMACVCIYGAVAKSSVSGLVSTGFISRYRINTEQVFLKAQWIGERPLYTLFSH